MESIKPSKRIIKKQLKNVNKAIIEIAEMKFRNIEEKEEKLFCIKVKVILCFF